jgi:hypothetical protein
MTKKKELTRTEKFYAWLQKSGNKYLSDTERMDRAFLIVQECWE